MAKKFCTICWGGPLSTVATSFRRDRTACPLLLYLFAVFDPISDRPNKTLFPVCDFQSLGPRNCDDAPQLGVRQRCLSGDRCFCKLPSRQCGLPFRVARIFL